MTAEEQKAEDEYASYLLGQKAKYEDLHRHDNGLKATIFELHEAKLYRRLVGLGYTRSVYSWMEQGPQ